MAQTSQTSAVLAQFAGKTAHRKCFVLNDARQLYVLEVERWEPDACQVIAKRPKGRHGSPDSKDSWQVTVRTFEGAYAFKVAAIETGATTLTLQLEAECEFAARRSKVRLQTESRNPILVQFELAEGEQAISSELIDFSREGLGLLWTEAPRLEMGQSIWNGRFRVCSENVSFDRAEVVHAQAIGDTQQRIGIRFTRITGKQAAAIKSAFDTCFLMQPYVSSTALDS